MAILNGRVALGLALAIVAVPAHSQSGDLGIGIGSVSPEALKASEARVKAWYAKPDILALKAEADAGKAARRCGSPTAFAMTCSAKAGRATRFAKI